jgi:hypothetical protein
LGAVAVVRVIPLLAGAFFAGAFFAGAFFAGAFFATVFFAGAFFAGAFFVGAFLATGLLVAVFLAGAFFVTVFFVTVFLAEAFFAAMAGVEDVGDPERAEAPRDRVVPPLDVCCAMRTSQRPTARSPRENRRSEGSRPNRHAAGGSPGLCLDASGASDSG